MPRHGTGSPAIEITKISLSASVIRWRSGSEELISLRQSVASTPPKLLTKAVVAKPLATIQSQWLCAVGAANCSSSQALYPTVCTCAMSASVPPKAACARKREACAALMGAGAGLGVGDGVGLGDGLGIGEGARSTLVSPPPPPQADTAAAASTATAAGRGGGGHAGSSATAPAGPASVPATLGSSINVSIGSSCVVRR